ncbi:hypothetical protein, variant [Verruconis gallopava]|uniref:Restriction endonuclease type IV Mrr domain-containing protein n=1 Tax=Verruconis gallopava TaxID=253628 RepID=A0A0D1YN47_9PEZI|nr:hypothetical protein, variant [Verruconis gallopava]KIW02177.1 hypothetical protein, variant [Verruconis gallopava]
MFQRCLLGSKNRKATQVTDGPYLTSRSPASNTSIKETWKRPVTITRGSEHHHDLASFLEYAKRERLSDSSNVYLGTVYEYTAAASVARLGFDVVRTGRTADFGIDLLGWWRLPTSPDPIKVLLQCKAYERKLGPQYIRELEGSFPGAPAHWQGQGVMGFLVAPSQATKGMRDAMIKSSLPLGFMQVTREGKILQMLWNHKVALWGLEGFGVVKKLKRQATTCDVNEEIALTLNGRTLDLSERPSTENATGSAMGSWRIGNT